MEEPGTRTAERAAEAQTPEAKIAWVLVVVAAVFAVFFPILGVVLGGIAAFLAHRAGAQTPRLAAIVVAVLALLMLLFQGTGGFLGEGDLFNA